MCARSERAKRSVEASWRARVKSIKDAFTKAKKLGVKAVGDLQKETLQQHIIYLRELIFVEGCAHPDVVKPFLLEMVKLTISMSAWLASSGRKPKPKAAQAALAEEAAAPKGKAAHTRRPAKGLPAPEFIKDIAELKRAAETPTLPDPAHKPLPQPTWAVGEAPPPEALLLPATSAPQALSSQGMAARKVVVDAEGKQVNRYAKRKVRKRPGRNPNDPKAPKPKEQPKAEAEAHVTAQVTQAETSVASSGYRPPMSFSAMLASMGETPSATARS